MARGDPVSAWHWAAVSAAVALVMSCFVWAIRAAERDEPLTDGTPSAADPADGDAGRGTDSQLLARISHLDFDPDTTREDR
jgi:hypothetical protein